MNQCGVNGEPQNRRRASEGGHILIQIMLLKHSSLQFPFGIRHNFGEQLADLIQSRCGLKLTSTGGGTLRDSGHSTASLPPPGSYRRCRGWWPGRSSGRLSPTSDCASRPPRTSGAPAVFGFAGPKKKKKKKVEFVYCETKAVALTPLENMQLCAVTC